MQSPLHGSLHAPLTLSLSIHPVIPTLKSLAIFNPGHALQITLHFCEMFGIHRPESLKSRRLRDVMESVSQRATLNAENRPDACMHSPQYTLLLPWTQQNLATYRVVHEQTTPQRSAGKITLEIYNFGCFFLARFGHRSHPGANYRLTLTI